MYVHVLINVYKSLYLSMCICIPETGTSCRKPGLTVDLRARATTKSVMLFQNLIILGISIDLK